ncbi:SRPBCC domain-containing protein [Georgenia sp. AZ-5]|uniref:SRPBCC family protein n=1 Tax=Georgenia sp. AZ-5 TaxID=3367526 RepID=UPI00375467AB
MKGFVSTATVEIAAPPSAVWRALVTSELAGRYMLGATVSSDFPRQPITFAGTWEGRAFVDLGEILQVEEPRPLRYSHFSPLSGQADVPENYHELTFALQETDGGTRVT